MTNVPPPDPDSSRLGFDELLGIVIAFATIGTILAVTLGQRDKGFNLSRLLNPEARAPTASPSGVIPLPQQTPVPTVSPEATLLPGQEDIAPSPSPTSITRRLAAPVPTAQPVPAEAPQAGSTTIPIIVPAPLAEASPTPTPVAAATPIKFTDVPQDLWARPYIEALASRGIVSGFPDGTFKPGGAITRAEFAALLQKAFEQQPTSTALNYKDVPTSHWALPAIDQSVKTGFFRGYPNNIFRPNQPISKVQTIVALASGLGLKPTTVEQDVLKTYEDSNRIPNYAKAPVSAATTSGLVVNYPNPNILNPNRNASRAEVAALVYQGMVESGKVEPMPSQYLVKP
ncbi:S-layer homology domain-containing protein [Allocoleopsis franciscana]|uniref:Putative S-layer protein n=1 Tax=Allocoleopsis franciscana PCC 7113 TaxID=1173027 RepID=K9WMY4_9CYAN|nr:S-layer homology domain-containing protein [Allocoleopsis franciscana]AFZ21114.1 putative S-layer protein [Allocoleopsis franciscana PCC 7113]